MTLAQGDQGLFQLGHGCGLGERGNDALTQGKVLIRCDELRIKGRHGADARTLRASALWPVEGEQLRRGRGHAVVAFGTGGIRGVDDIRLAGHADDDPALAPAQGQFHRVGQPGAHVVADHQTIHHQIDGVLLVLVQRGHFLNIQNARLFALRGYAYAHKTFGLKLLEAIGMGAFLQLDQRGHDDDLFAFRQGHDVRDDFVRRTRLDGRAALDTIGLAEPGEEHAQKVVDFRHRAHCGTGVAACRLLFKRNGRRKPLNLVHQRFVHFGQKLAGIGRKGFHIAALAFRVYNVKGQSGLA